MTLLAVRVRSGLEETLHDGAVAVCWPDGTLRASAGDIDRPFFIRSAAKPFQALSSQESGASLSPVELAVASSSHRGHPVQVAVVASILDQGGLAQDHLQCPPDWPVSRGAALKLELGGSMEARRIWHNCSGKHAGFLRASLARGWPTDTYLDPDHPLQTEVTSLIEELGEYDPGPVGVDGCGAPVFRTTVRAMARMYSRLGSDERLRDVYSSMHSYPALISDARGGDAVIATVVDSVAKGGAMGCIGVALKGGVGVAAKSWDGLGEVAVLGAISALDQIDRLPRHATSIIADHAAPPVLGGGRVVGRLEPRFRLKVP